MTSLMRRLRQTLPLGGDRRHTLVYHPAYRQSVAGVPLDALRADRILSFLLESRIVRRGQVSTPRPATLEALLRVHERRYLHSLEDPAVVGEILGLKVSPEQARLAISLQRLITGGTVRAAHLAVRTGRPIVHLAGGLHHARPERGMGFCIFNDVAVALRSIRAHGFAAPILVVDLDLHDANGTRAAFRGDGSVHTFSIHNAPWDDDEAAATTRLPLGSGVDDARYLGALHETLPAVIARHRPELVLYVAGTDVAHDDALGDWRISAAGMMARDRYVVEQWRGLGPGVPLVVVLGGGYGGSAWRYYARFFSWLLSGHVLEPPDAVALAEHRLEEIRAAVAAPPARGHDWLDWRLDEEDVAGALGTPAAVRLLDRYDAHQVETLLEHAGVLGQLRARGFAQPDVEVRASVGLGDTLRIWTSRRRTALLLELRLGRNRRLIPGMEVLWIEWLLLQNPRLDFTSGRPPLPGQQRPGLGILPDVVAFLVALAADLGLDGVAFRSSQYHVAALTRAHLRFLEPRMHALVQAVEDLTPGWTLARRANAIRQGRFIDMDDDAPLEWPQVCMILPLSDALRHHLDAAARDQPAPPPPHLRLRSTPSSRSSG